MKVYMYLCQQEDEYEDIYGWNYCTFDEEDIWSAATQAYETREKGERNYDIAVYLISFETEQNIDYEKDDARSIYLKAKHNNVDIGYKLLGYASIC